VATIDAQLKGIGGIEKIDSGTLTLTGDNDYSGGTTINAGTLRIGDGGSTGSIVGDIVNNATLVVDRADALTLDGTISGSGALMQAGAGTTTLTADNNYRGGTTISAGTLRLGDGGSTGGIVGDIVNNAALVVDRANAFTLDGIISGSGSLAQAGAGTTTLAAASTYTGATQVAAGTLRAGIANAFSSSSAYQVSGGATLDTGGFDQTVAALDNTGTVNLLSATPGSTLTVTGAYVGHGGTLRLGTTLGDSNSASDRLVLDGPGASASGTTVLQIANVNGLGALTSGDGIEVISARNGATTTAQTTRDAFVLGGGLATAGIANAATPLAAPHIDVGAYEYRLYAGDANGAGETWYLRSTATDLPIDITYRIETPLLAALPAQLRQSDLAMLGNLQRRMGDTGAAQADADPLDRHAWARALYTDLDIRQDGTVTPRSNGYLSGLQAGIDLLWSNRGWRTGVYGGYLQGNADVSGYARGVNGAVGRNDLRARYVGGYATWMDAEDGRYIDMVLQYGSHHYRVRPDLNANVSGDASSLTASIELGHPLALSAQWSLEPQAQLAYQKGDIDELRLSGAQVRQDSEGGWIGRLGIRVKGDLATSAGRFQPYARANLYLASAGADVARFIAPAATTDIATRNGYTSGELAAGMTLELNRNVSLYAEAGHMFDLSGGARVRSSIQANAGVRIGWK
jgi:autotransporter-associated beta strand protein